MKFKLALKPLSVNKAFQGKRFKTKEYKQFERDMLLMLPKVKIDFKGNLRVDIDYGFSSVLSDIDNPNKMVLDVLCKKYGFDDRQIFELNNTKTIVKKGQEFIICSITQLKNQ